MNTQEKIDFEQMKRDIVNMKEAIMELVDVIGKLNIQIYDVEQTTKGLINIGRGMKRL